eukprot:SAG31_NODE_16591_length_703_cov_0.940397_1_plen_159_part_10
MWVLAGERTQDWKSSGGKAATALTLSGSMESKELPETDQSTSTHEDGAKSAVGAATSFMAEDKESQARSAADDILETLPTESLPANSLNPDSGDTEVTNQLEALHHLERGEFLRSHCLEEAKSARMEADMARERKSQSILDAVSSARKHTCLLRAWLAW